MNDFRQRMVLITRPYEWNPESKARWAHLLAKVLEGGRPGRAEWAPPVPRDESQPVDPEIKTREASWSPSAEPELVPDVGNDDEWTHEALGTLFLTGPRLFSLMAESKEASAFAPRAPRTVFSLQLNLATIDHKPYLVPQLRMSDYWPFNRQLAPRRQRATVAKPAAATEKILNDDLWVAADNAFGRFLRDERLTAEPVEAIQYEFRPPVFYFSVPADPPSGPGGFLENEAFTAVRILCHDTIGSVDPCSEQVVGFLVEGSVLMLRREYVLPIEAPQYQGFRKPRTEIHHLCLGCLTTAPDDVVRMEWDLCFAAQRLSLLDIRTTIGLSTMDKRVTQALSSLERLSAGRETLEQEVDRIVRGQLPSAERVPAHLDDVQRQLLDTRLSLLRQIRVVDLLDRDAAELVEDAATKTERALTYSSVDGLQPLTGARLRSSPAATIPSNQMRTATRQAARMRDDVDTLSAYFDAVAARVRTETQRRELDREKAAAERERHHREEQEQHEQSLARRQARLTIGLSILAAATVVGLVVGQFQRKDVEDAYNRLGSWKWIGKPAKFLAVDFGDPILLVSVFIAAALILVLPAYLIFQSWRDRPRTAQSPTATPPAL